MLIYENQIIGNFLFGAGAKYGFQKALKGEGPPICVNLLQQAPPDKFFGDTLFHTSKFVRIIEFKRRENRDNKEGDKLNILSRALGEDSDMQAVSRRIHWYVESFNGSETWIVPYLDFLNKTLPGTTLKPFIEQTITAVMAGSEGSLMGLCREYLTLLMLCNGPGDVGSGAMIFAISDEGTIGFAAIEEMIDLRLTPAELAAPIREREQARQREIKELRRELKRELSLDQGMSR